MRIAIVTDAWRPQVNGVVTTLEHTVEELGRRGDAVRVIAPGNDRFSIPCPTYPEIRLSFGALGKVRAQIADFAPDRIHIATEGPLGAAARRYCLNRNVGFTTAYHTRFPEYVGRRFPWPSQPVARRYVRWFHRPSQRVMVSTTTIADELGSIGITQTALWPRGVDTRRFRPRDRTAISAPEPIWAYMGRVAIEKGLDDFLRLDLPGTKYVIGDGPDMSRLRERYPNAVFAGYRFGDELAAMLASADVFVFPSRTDTFGLVMLEAMACGLPVAAFPVPGPLDVVNRNVTGVLDEDLGAACLRALTLDRSACREYAKGWSWAAATDRFAANLAPISPAAVSGVGRRSAA